MGLAKNQAIGLLSNHIDHDTAKAVVEKIIEATMEQVFAHLEKEFAEIAINIPIQYKEKIQCL